MFVVAKVYRSKWLEIVYSYDIPKCTVCLEFVYIPKKEEEIFTFRFSLISLITNRNELMGLEGMVKLKNPDHSSTNDVIAISNDPKSNDAEAKRYRKSIFQLFLPSKI